MKKTLKFSLLLALVCMMAIPSVLSNPQFTASAAVTQTHANLYNVNDPDVSNGTLSRADGTTVASTASYVTSGYISVNEGKWYEFNTGGSWLLAYDRLQRYLGYAEALYMINNPANPEKLITGFALGFASTFTTVHVPKDSGIAYIRAAFATSNENPYFRQANISAIEMRLTKETNPSLWENTVVAIANGNHREIRSTSPWLNCINITTAQVIPSLLSDTDLVFGLVIPSSVLGYLEKFLSNDWEEAPWSLTLNGTKWSDENFTVHIRIAQATSKPEVTPDGWPTGGDSNKFTDFFKKTPTWQLVLCGIAGVLIIFLVFAGVNSQFRKKKKR